MDGDATIFDRHSYDGSHEHERGEVCSTQRVARGRTCMICHDGRYRDGRFPPNQMKRCDLVEDFPLELFCGVEISIHRTHAESDDPGRVI